MDNLLFAMEIHSLSDEEIEKRKIECFNYFLSLGVDPCKTIELMGLTIESSIREWKKNESV